jgi:hypothetical protein
VTDADTIALAGGIAAAAGAAWRLWKGRAAPDGTPPADMLERCLLRWTPHDPFTLRSLLNGGICVLGRPGSGKTSSSGRLIGRECINLRRADGRPAINLLILAAKPVEDLELWQGIYREAGREDELLVFAPGGNLRCNFLDTVVRSGGTAREVTRFLMVANETLRASDAKGGENADYWERETERMIEHAVTVVLLATGRVDAWDLLRFVSDAAPDAGVLVNEETVTDQAARDRIVRWKAGFHNECIRKAFHAQKSDAEAHAFELARQYWLREIPHLNDRTRSSISTHVLGLLHVMNSGVVRQLTGGESNVSPADLLGDRSILVDCPPSELGDAGLFLANSFKYLTQRLILKRRCDVDAKVVGIWGDESHAWVQSYDAHFVNQARSRLGFLVYLNQSVSSYYAALGGSHRGKHQTEALLAAFSHVIVHACDPVTAEWGCSKIGKRLQIDIGGSVQPPKDALDALLGWNNHTSSFSEHVRSVVEAREMMTGLRCGGPPDFTADAFVIRSGETFAHGDNWLKVSFSQR